MGKSLESNTAGAHIFPVADLAGHDPAADLLTQRIGIHDQAAWMAPKLA